MRLPFALAALDWISPRHVQGARIALDLDGHPGWTCRAGDGFCVATAVPWPREPDTIGTLSAGPQALDSALCDDTPLSRWLMHLALVLAASPELRDDSLCLARDTVWWLHRFDATAPVARVEAQLRRQLLACTMVASRGARPAARSAASLRIHGSTRLPDMRRC
ncbi:hypothetical protein [Pandoraea pulmonicola]|uniref:Uncharacterized protein n=1 Tax=Pandoraea pulmonicola TaxID=93221 RepID=A0AAJ4ZB57_PANPU|nr:hypothetical protein [Pandoraea pulmonicola]AJC21153.1 hypothetical protein RO07_12940 [Pandoraea pulmonicola]SUA90179.1 Uncharacterised protein [Pandoraea pulmonicola]